MKSFYAVAVLAALCGVEATSASTTITCSSCKPASSTPDVVTRSDVPVSSCTAPALTAVYESSANGTASPTGSMPTSSGAPNPSDVPVAGASHVAGGIVGAAAAAVAALYLM